MKNKIYRINLTGIGGEVCVFNISKEAYEFWSQEDQQELQDYIFSWDIEANCPSDADFMDRENVEPEWTDHPDEIEHLTGVSFYNGYISVEEVEKAQSDSKFINTIIEKENIEDFFESKNDDLIWVDKEEVEPDTFVCSAMSIEKGHFFEGYIKLKKDFDTSKLNLEITMLPNEESIVSQVLYDGEKVEGEFISTIGKTYYASLNKGY